MGVPKDTLFRSADMSLTQLYIANEIGREVVSALGEIGEVQFRDVSIPLAHYQLRRQDDSFQSASMLGYYLGFGEVKLCWVEQVFAERS